jgi:alpha-tubulin suppressor-like RCC1 family protein
MNVTRTAPIAALAAAAAICAVAQVEAAPGTTIVSVGEMTVNDSISIPIVKTPVLRCSGICASPVALSAGEATACALYSNGTVKCWGSNNKDALGDGNSDMTQASSSVSVAVQNITGASSIAFGDYTGCAIESGAVQCWGSDASGQLGNASVTWYDSPTPVSVTNLSGVTAVAVNGDGACAVLSSATLAPLGGENLACWGWRGTYPQLGLTAMTPQAASLVRWIAPIVSLAAGTTGFCALTTTDLIECWGRQFNTGTPVAEWSLSNATSIAMGQSFFCALMSNGTVDCWGDNSSGQVGNGTTISPSPNPAAVSGLSNVTGLSLGLDHGCAITSGGQVECWGDNTWGEIGNGVQSNTPQTTPTTVCLTGTGTSCAPLAKVTQVAAGDGFTCAIAAGATYCWGNNVYGQLGDGAPLGQLYSPNPVVVQ